MDREYILCAAIWFDDGIYHKHQPTPIETGYVICGYRHDNCYLTWSLMNNVSVRESSYPHNKQGFLTSFDRFVDREEGAVIAFLADQIHKETECLISEDLY